MIAKAVMSDPSLHIEAKAIYAYIASYAGAGETAFPGIEIMVDHLNISKTRFYKYRQELVKQGYITITPEKDDRGKFAHNIYTILTTPCPQIEYAGNGYTDFKDANSNSLNTNSNKSNRNKINKGIFPSSQNTALSFSEFEKQYTVDEEAYGAISHYLLCYEQQFGECHPRLKAEQWQRAVDKILYCAEIGGDLEVDQIKAMIDQHFCTRYRDCDYNILHFLSEGVKNNRFFKEVK